MYRTLGLVLVALALLAAPLAMQSGRAMAAMPIDRHHKAEPSHCGEEAPEVDDAPYANTQCCVAMCSATEPLGAPSLDPAPCPAQMRFSPVPSTHRPFLADLPTPPPRAT